MSSRCLRFLLVGLAPIALAACADIEPATGSPIPTAPVVGVDLGGSRSFPSMSGTVHGSMDRESMPGMSGSQRQMLPAHGSMPGMDHAKHKMQMAHSGHGHVQGTGTVNSVDATAHKLNVSHGPIPTIGLPAM